MEITIADLSSSRKNITVCVPSEEVVRMEASVLKDVVKHARLQGFRPGKAPLDLVRKRYELEIQKELRSEMRKMAVDKMAKDSGLKIYSVLSTDFSEIQPGKAVDVIFQVELAPEFELPDYASIAISVPTDIITEQEIEEGIANRQKGLAKFEVVEKAAEKGDYVKVSYEGRLDGQLLTEIIPNAPLFAKQNNTWEEAGAVGAPGIQSIIQGVVGLKAGDTTHCVETFPEDFSEAALAGKSVNYEVSVHEVRTRVLPEINSSEFLKHHEVDSVEAFRETFVHQLQNRKHESTLNLKANRLMEALRKQISIEVPESAIKAKLPELIERFLASEVARKTPAEVLTREKDQILADLQSLAIQRLQDEFILDAVIQKEAFKLEEHDLQRRILQEAAEARIQVADYVKKLQKKPEAIREFQRRTLRYKALEFLMERATVTIES